MASARPEVELRAAIELAVGVARQGEAAQPSVPAPHGLRPFLSFARLPPSALDAARRAVEHDAEFRRRVAAEADREALGEAGWLWLTRPKGWEARLDQLRLAAQAEHHAAADERAERRAVRRLAAAEEAAARAERRAEEADKELDAARVELVELRRLLLEVEGERAQLVAELERARVERVSAIRQLKAVEAALTDRGRELNQAKDELRVALRELGELRRSAPTTPAVTPPVTPAVAPAATPPVTPPGLAAVHAGPALALAAEKAAELSRALEAAAAAVAPPAGSALPDAPAGREGPSESPAAALRAGGEAAAAAGRPNRAGARRRPTPIPLGLFEDTVEAAEQLTRAPDMVLLVDGYNVSKQGWPELDLADQRRRLVDALCGLAARTGCHPDVVFDGAEPLNPTPHRSHPQRVRVRFSPAGVEADDVILALIDRYPLHRPVTVVSSDRRVASGARDRGANTLASGLLLELL